MAHWKQVLKFGCGVAVGLVGVALLVASFAVSLEDSEGTLAVNGPPLLFVSALVALRVGVLMSKQASCSTCGTHATSTPMQCPRCDEPTVG